MLVFDIEIEGHRKQAARGAAEAVSAGTMINQPSIESIRLSKSQNKSLNDRGVATNDSYNNNNKVGLTLRI